MKQNGEVWEGTTGPYPKRTEYDKKDRPYMNKENKIMGVEVGSLG